MWRFVHRTGVCALIWLGALLSAVRPSTSLSVDVARKCYELTQKTHPRAKKFVPYRGGDTWEARLRQAFYSSCIAAGGKVEN